MKNRREFLHLSTVGFLSPLWLPLHMSDKFGAESKTGIVKQPEDGETYFVRENTPITIQVSKKKDSAETISLCTEEILPGNKIPVHKHLNEDEFFIFLKGTGSIQINGEEYPVKLGTSGLVPRATWHSIANNGSEALIFTFGYSPSGFEDFFRQIGTPKGIPFKAKT
jgi:mannose-6-phosphate isomerase-like protein (cupin superfamily)